MRSFSALASVIALFSTFLITSILAVPLQNASYALDVSITTNNLEGNWTIMNETDKLLYHTSLKDFENNHQRTGNPSYLIFSSAGCHYFPRAKGIWDFGGSCDRLNFGRCNYIWQKRYGPLASRAIYTVFAHDLRRECKRHFWTRIFCTAAAEYYLKVLKKSVKYPCQEPPE